MVKFIFERGGLSAHCMKGITEMVTGSGASKARKEQARINARQEAAQKEQMAAQEAAQNRQQQRLNTEEDRLLAETASSRRAIYARRRGRGALSFTPSGGLKSKLGE